MRLAVLEEALQSGAGHWPLYIGDIATAFRQAGYQTDVLAHFKADSRLLSELNATPWFSHNCWSEPSRQGGLGGLRHSLRYAYEVLSWLRSHPNDDWVCALTMRLQHLLAYTWVCRRPWNSCHRRYLLLFVQGFGTYQGPDLPVAFPPTVSIRLARWCFRRLAPVVRSGRVVLAVETRAMQSELEAFTGLPVRLFPHPVSLSNNFPSLSCVPSKNRSKTITITCPGFSRYEKGNDLLQDACKHIFASESALDVRVLCQWPKPFALPNGSMVSPDPSLIASDRYLLVNELLTRQAYAELLSSSDLIILPYRRSSYHNRVSRVAIEAALYGIPLVYMSRTWCEELVKLTGAGVPILEETPDAVAHALLTAIHSLQMLSQRAQNAKSSVQAHFSAERFCQLLLDC